MINKNELADELTDKFIEYQWRLDNPFPSPEQTPENMFMKYRSDHVFHAKVKNLVAGVIRIVGKHDK